MKGVSLLRSLLAALLLGTLLSVAAVAKEPAAVEGPALWTVHGPKNKVYLLGALHVLPPQAKWRTRAIERAFGEAEVFVFEIDLASAQDPQAAQPLMLKYGLLRAGENLRGVLPKATYTELERTAAGLGLAMQNIESMRPWLVALTLTVQGVVQAGYVMDSGVDHQTDAWARAHGKKIGALETMEGQLKIFAFLTREQEIEFLTMTLAEEKDMQRTLGEMVAAYLKGDTVAMEKLFIGSMDSFPSLRRSLLNDRHDKWLPKIEKMMNNGRPHVVVVGAAHLLGPDSIVAMLRARGVQVEGP